MCTADNPYAMAKPDKLSEMPHQNFSPPKRTKFGFMFMDCCSFLSVGLGFDDDIAPCASIALMDSDDGGGSISDDSEMLADSSSVFRDIFTLDASCEAKDEVLKTEDDNTKTSNTIFTISTLTMEKFAEGKRVLPKRKDDEELPSKLVLLSENLVSGEKLYPEDEEESRTLNTLSTFRIPSSLDTKTEEIPPSLDTKTFDRTLVGLKVLETTVGGTTQEDTGRNFINRSYARPRNLYDIERVPSSVDTHGNDDRSIVSAISIEDDTLVRNGIEGREPITKRLFKRKKGKILRPWSWKNKKPVHDTDAEKVQSVWQEPSRAITNTKDLLEPLKVSSRLSATIMKPTKPPVPSPIPSPQRLPEFPTEACRSIVPVIKPTKSNDVTASTIATDEDDYYHAYGDNVPFDEPHTCSPRFLAIEKIRVGQYLRPSSNVEVQEI